MDRAELERTIVNLFAVDGPTNGQQSDYDAVSWPPPNRAFRCAHIAYQVGVKPVYGLWMPPLKTPTRSRLESLAADYKSAAVEDECDVAQMEEGAR